MFWTKFKLSPEVDLMQQSFYCVHGPSALGSSDTILVQ